MVVISALGISPAGAYSLEGLRWDNTPTSGCCAGINVQCQSAMAFIDIAGWDNARWTWNASPANVTLYNGSGALTVDDVSHDTVGWDGITYYAGVWCSTGTYFQYASLYLNYYYTRNYSAATIQGVAAHELGHAIGLAHTDGCVLMTPYTNTRDSCGIYGPYQDDVNGVNALY